MRLEREGTRVRQEIFPILSMQVPADKLAEYRTAGRMSGFSVFAVPAGEKTVIMDVHGIKGSTVVSEGNAGVIIIRPSTEDSFSHFWETMRRVATLPSDEVTVFTRDELNRMFGSSSNGRA